MAIDIIGIILIILCFMHGLRRGFILAAFSVIALLLGIICSLRFSATISAWFYDHNYARSGWVLVVCYIAMFILVVWLVGLVARLLQGLVDGLLLGPVNRIAGGILFIFLGAVMWSSLLWIGIKMQVITHEELAASKTYPYFSGIAAWFFEEVGHLLPSIKDTFTKLEGFFDHVNQTIPGHVGAH